MMLTGQTWVPRGGLQSLAGKNLRAFGKMLLAGKSPVSFSLGFLYIRFQTDPSMMAYRPRLINRCNIQRIGAFVAELLAIRKFRFFPGLAGLNEYPGSIQRREVAPPTTIRPYGYSVCGFLKRILPDCANWK
jgi:hypothetical protein